MKTTRTLTAAAFAAAALILTACSPEPDVQLPPPSVSTAAPDTTNETAAPDTSEDTSSAPSAETSNPNISQPAEEPVNDNSVIPVAGSYTTQTDITYHTATTTNGPVDLTLDLYTPATADGTPVIANQPAVLLIHGGAFLVGNKNMANMETWATELAKNGYVVANINYRLLPTSPIVSNPDIITYLASADPTAALPAQAPAESIAALRIGLGAAIEDANAALTWLTDQGVNPNRIAIAGESAGAITALHLAYLNDTLQLNPVTPAAIINLYGAMSKPTGGGTEITSSEPALWTLHGTNDIVVPYAAAEYLDEQTRNAGIPHTLHSATGKAHGFAAVEFFTGTTTDGTSYIDDQINFLKTHLSK